MIRILESWNLELEHDIVIQTLRLVLLSQKKWSVLLDLSNRSSQRIQMEFFRRSCKKDRSPDRLHGCWKHVLPDLYAQSLETDKSDIP